MKVSYRATPDTFVYYRDKLCAESKIVQHQPSFIGMFVNLRFRINVCKSHIGLELVTVIHEMY